MSLLLHLLLPGVLATQDPAPEAQGAARPVRPILLILKADSGAMERDQLREALAAALGAPVATMDSAPSDGTVPLLTVTWRPSRHELAVTYDAPARGTISRVVRAPDDARAAIAVATQLAVNLVRDDAAELLPAQRPPSKPIVVARPPPVIVAPPPTPPAPAERRFRPVTASLFFPLASNFDEPEARARLSLNIIYGRIGELAGAQLGFGINHVSGAVHGSQVAPINVAGDVTGLQLGLINVAGRVKGVQLGVINVADDIEGVPIGLVNVTKEGGVHPLLWSGTESRVNVGVKFSTRHVYSIFSVSERPEDTSQGLQSMYGPGWAMGARIPWSWAAFETDLGASYLFRCCNSPSDSPTDDRLLSRLRAILAFAVHPRFTLFAGAAMTVVTRFGSTAATRNSELGPELLGGVQL